MVSRGETALCARRPRRRARDLRIFRNQMIDPETRELLGLRRPYVGTAELMRPADDGGDGAGGGALVPDDQRAARGRIAFALSPVPPSGVAATCRTRLRCQRRAQGVGVGGEGAAGGPEPRSSPSPGGGSAAAIARGSRFLARRTQRRSTRRWPACVAIRARPTKARPAVRLQRRLNVSPMRWSFPWKDPAGRGDRFTQPQPALDSDRVRRLVPGDARTGDRPRA